MDERQRENLRRLAEDGIHFDCLMARYTTFRVGGAAEAVYEADNLENLRRVITYLSREQSPYLVVGRGSNLLVKDGGLEGMVIVLRGSLASVKTDTTNALTVLGTGGLSLSDLLAYCRLSGLGGLEFLAGIPGTLGGAVAMNAGAFGKDISERVEEVHLLRATGDVIVMDRTDLNFSYRGLRMDTDNVIVASRLRVNLESREKVAERISGYLMRRKKTQPIEYPSAGSVFKNPSHDYAVRLVEAAGLKVKKIGGAMISEKHANYIVNTGGATAKDILALLSLAQEKVMTETGVKLDLEIRVVGK